jgi:hypothetical protein
MRSFLTALLLIVFTAVHGLPAAAFSAPEAESDVMAMPLDNVQAAATIAPDSVQQKLKTCCGKKVSDATPHAGSKCSSDCATLLPASPGLFLPAGVRVHEDIVTIVKVAAPAVADHPPQAV